MLLRRTSVLSGATALALAGLLGFVGGASAQPPAADKVAPLSGGVPVGAAIGDSTGMLSMPIRAAAENAASGRGLIAGRMTQGGVGAAHRFVYLVKDGKVVASSKTDPSGAFETSAPNAGEYTFMAGPFVANGVARKMVRLDAADGAMQAVAMQTGATQGGATQQKGAPPGALVGGAAVDAADAFGFIERRFVLEGRPVFGGNDYVVQAGGLFRGVVTSVDDAGNRVAQPGANLTLVRRGAVVSRTVTGVNGAFTFTGVTAGGYTMIATIGDHGAAQVSLNANPNVNYGAVTPVASPYFAGLTAGVPGSVSVRFPFAAIAVQRIAIRDGALAPAGVSAGDAEFRIEGAEDVLVRVAFAQPGASTVPVVHLSPAPWEDLRLLIGTAQYDVPGMGLAPTPPVEGVGGFGGGGFGGGGGGFGGGGALAGLAAAAGLAGGGGGDGGGGFFTSPFRP